MLDGDAIDHLYVFRLPGTRPEVAAARRLLGGDPGPWWGHRLRTYVLVDIERPAPQGVVAAVEV
jgi:hypothetical protein